MVSSLSSKVIFVAFLSVGIFLVEVLEVFCFEDGFLTSGRFLSLKK